MEKKEAKEDFVKWFSQLSNKSVNVAGGKGASLAEMYNNHFPIPPGFVVTAQAYFYFIKQSGLSDKIKKTLERLNVDDTAELNEVSKKIRKIIDESDIPKELEEEIVEAYNILDVEKNDISKAKGSALDILRNSHEPPFVAVRSSATAEDLADASFAGQQDSFLAVKGNKQLLQKFKECCSSLFTARAIYYRKKKGFDNMKTGLAVVVQKMINSQKSGVMFSKNPVKNDDMIVIEAVWGLGEGIVSGKILPDHYELNKELSVQDMKVAEKKIALVRSGAGKVEEVRLTQETSAKQVLTGHELKKLAQYALQLEEHYGKPQDIEFAIADNEIYIVQSRPITTKVQDNEREVSGNVLLSGMGASPGVGVGRVRIVHNLEDLDKVQKGDILVTEMTNPDMVVSMQRASGIVTDEGGLTSHASIVSREMGIPCVVATKEATRKLKDGQIVSVDGFTGRVIEGKAEEKKVVIEPIVHTRTKIKVIVDLPDYAKRAALSGAESVGLVRLEGIIGTSGKHPVWYIKNDNMKEYVRVLSTGLKKISIPFKEIWIRTSDIRSDEYQHLEGAPQKVEGNPMLGDHGIRFSLKNVDLLEAELMAIKEIADEFPDKVFGVMTPQVISVEEVKGLKKAASEVKMPSNVKIGIMIETPAAVQIIKELCEEGLSFISFGTNDLTQFTLALDRNNPNVQDLYNEMHPAILHSLTKVIEVCKKYKIETSICGQAASKLEMARFLVGEGIDSISVNADAARRVSELVAEIEGSKIEAIENDENESGGGIKEDVPVVAGGLSQTPIVPMMNATMKDEEIILKALEEYVPAKEIGSDVPPLNDAIPISEEDFNQEMKKEDIEDEVSNVF